MIVLDTDVCIEFLRDADLFVAAVALEKAEVLATGNAKHFERIEGLKIENWAA